MNFKHSLVLVAVGCVASMAGAQSFNFDAPVVTGVTQAPGTWYTDRYAPAGFTSPVNFMGDNRLRQTISSADGEVDRPGGFTGTFYNTQGRKYDLNAGITAMSIDLFIDSGWATTGRRMAGFWGTAFDNLNAVSGFPILEFTSTVGDADGSGARFRAWNNGTWINMGLPTAFAYGQFIQLNITLSGGMFNYQVGDAVASVSAGTSTRIANVILQGHNTNQGVDYDIYWDNFNAPGASPVPEPMTMGLMGIVAAAAYMKKRRKS